MSKPYRAWVAAAAVAPLLASLHAPRVLAETVVVGDQVQVRQTDVAQPKRGSSMAQVQKSFGEPRERHPTVGTPPITRWDYEHFAVFFEKDLVIDTVVPGSSSSGGTPDAGPSATPVNAPDSAPEAAPIPAAAPPAAGPALDAAGIPLHQPDPVQPAAAAAPGSAPAATEASAPAAAQAPGTQAASTPKGGTDVPLSNVSLHH